MIETNMRQPATILISLLLMSALAGCASYSGNSLKPGVAQLDNVVQVMGTPAMRWQNADGSQQLAYPRGPQGTQTFMAHIGPDGVLQCIEPVLDHRHFKRIQPGDSETQVLRTIGPPQPSWSVFYKARNELAWEWRYCDATSQLARFNVLFDASTHTVRNTMSLTEDQLGLCGSNGGCWCAG
jgi:hypothetical protein